MRRLRRWFERVFWPQTPPSLTEREARENLRPFAPEVLEKGPMESPQSLWANHEGNR